MVYPTLKIGGLVATGKYRYRYDKSWFGKPKMVLQLQESFYYYLWTDWQSPDQPTRYRWRDVTLEDISEGNTLCES